MLRAVGKAACFAALALVVARGGTSAALQTAAVPRSSAASPQSSLDAERLQEAREFLEKGKTGEGIELLRRILRHNPQDGDAHLLLGDALAALPERAEALQELKRGVALEPRSAVAYFSLGSAEARFADMTASRKAFEKAVQLDAGFAAAHISLALVLAQQKQLDAAKDNLSKAIDVLGSKPSAAYPHYLLAQVLVGQAHPHQALSELRAATALQPGYARAYLSEGLIENTLHNSAAALHAFRQAAGLSPRDAEIDYELGGAYLRSGMAREAVEPLRRASEMRPGDRKALYQLCEALQRVGNKVLAAECQQRLSRLVRNELAMSDNLSAAGKLNNEGIELERVGNVAAALAKYRAAVKLDPAQTVFRRNLALALCRLGDWQEGVAELRTVLKQHPDDAEATKALYIALDKAGAAKKAGLAGRGPKSVSGPR